jgi:phytol kinase
MNAIFQNIIVTFAALIYVFGVVALMDYAVKKGFSQDLSRKVVHIAAGSWLIFWPLYNQSHWTKFLNITPALIWTILLLIKGFTAKPDDQAVKTMTRTGDRKELLRGPLYFTLVMNIMGTFFFYSPGALMSMGFLGWGDGLAPVFGKKFGKHKYHILSEKSLEGSIAFFVFGVIGAALFSYIFFSEINFSFLLICGLVTTIVEGASPKDFDNILIPVSSMIVYYIFAKS